MICAILKNTKILEKSWIKMHLPWGVKSDDFELLLLLLFKCIELCELFWNEYVNCKFICLPNELPSLSRGTEK